MRDGDSGHGNPYEPAADEVALDSDNDVGDTTDEDDAADELADSTEPRTVEEPPFPGYHGMSIPDIFERVNGLSDAELEKVIAYEQAHRNRKTLLIKLGRMVRPPKK